MRQNNLRKIGCLIFCILIMIGSGACDILLGGGNTLNIREEKQFIIDVDKRIHENKSTDTDYLIYAFALKSKDARKILNVNYLSPQQVNEEYKKNLAKSMEKGNIEAELNYSTTLYQEALIESDSNLKHKKLSESLYHFENVLRTHCTSKSLQAEYPNLHLYNSSQNPPKLIVNQLNWVNEIFRKYSKDFAQFPDIIKTAQILMLYNAVHCNSGNDIYKTSKSISENEIIFDYTLAKLSKNSSNSYYFPTSDSIKQSQLREKGEMLYSFYLLEYGNPHP